MWTGAGKVGGGGDKKVDMRRYAESGEYVDKVGKRVGK